MEIPRYTSSRRIRQSAAWFMVHRKKARAVGGSPRNQTFWQWTGKQQQANKGGEVHIVRDFFKENWKTIVVSVVTTIVYRLLSDW